MIAPRYVGASTTAGSPLSTSAFPRSSSASIAPLVSMSSSSAGRRPWIRSSRSATSSRGPGRPATGAYWNGEASPRSASSRRISAIAGPGNVAGSGKPPVKEMTSSAAASERIWSSPSPAPPRVRAAKSASHRRTSGSTATAAFLRTRPMGPSNRLLLAGYERVYEGAGVGFSRIARRRRARTCSAAT